MDTVGQSKTIPWRWLIVGACGALVVGLGLPSFVALALGAALALSQSTPILDTSHASKIGNKLMKASIVALGAGMNLGVVLQVGRSGLASTAFTLALALGLGYGIGRLLGVRWETAALVTAGTAICGGSAIAAMAPVIRAKASDIGVALGVVFLLNAVALFLFPFLGTWLDMDPTRFGRWCALAIHDTSSVVGAATEFGPEALEIATVTKLARALWIIPMVFVAAWWIGRKGEADGDGKRPSIPVFILMFVGVAALVSAVPALQESGKIAAKIGRQGLILALFFIGLGFSRNTLKALGTRPLALGVALWVSLGSASLLVLG